MTGKQKLLWLAALVALVVAVVFVTVGDGVTSEATGLRKAVVDYGHAATWLMLATALGLTAWGKAHKQVVNAVWWLALVFYVGFLAAVFI